MRTLVAVSRIALGLIFLILGLNAFHPFIKVPSFSPFMAILVASGYIYLIKVIEVVAGILLLSNRYVPLALVLLGPDIVNILAYHILLDHRDWPIAFVNLVFYSIVLWAYRGHFVPLLSKGAKPVV